MVPRINRNNEVENTGYMLNELMKAKVNRLRLSVRSYINPTEQNKPPKVITILILTLLSIEIDMTMSLYLFLDMYLHSGEYHVGTVGIDIRNYIFAVLMR